ncbi:MAG: sugar phosphate isomerase/epimerase, partial [Chitinophagaceae bacterium]|nr:sugar phosphate isomerase/epimerase [Chitinophagaceae bacterium]
MVCTSFGVNYPDLVNKTAEVGENAQTLGATYVRVAWIPHGDKGFTLEDAIKTVADFNKAGELLKEKYGLVFCYHNHGYEFAKHENGTFFDYIVNNTDPKYVSFELDILWAFHPGADPAALIKKYPKRFKLMHVKDLKKGIKGDLTGKTAIENDVALGTGQLNLPQILEAARSSSIEYYYIEDESNSVQAQLPVSLAFLQRWLKIK